jgi:hypothetical protein
MIRGRGQTVYWRGSDVTVYERDSEGKEHTTILPKWPEGHRIVPSGTKLYITEGSIKEE